jgi:ABC-type proline/glycine betaine transport system permease subunit
MDGFRIPVGEWVDTGVDWVRDNLAGLFDVIAVVVRFLVDGLTDGLTAIPVAVAIALFALLGWFFRSWQMALGTAISFILIVAMDLWVAAMQTLSLVRSPPSSRWSSRSPSASGRHATTRCARSSSRSWTSCRRCPPSST